MMGKYECIGVYGHGGGRKNNTKRSRNGIADHVLWCMIERKKTSSEQGWSCCSERIRGNNREEQGVHCSGTMCLGTGKARKQTVGQTKKAKQTRNCCQPKTINAKKNDRTKWATKAAKNSKLSHNKNTNHKYNHWRSEMQQKRRYSGKKKHQKRGRDTGKNLQNNKK